MAASPLMLSLSNLAGWLSLSAWLCVYSPYVPTLLILEIYLLKTGEGVSVLFIAIWLAGDITNAYGAFRSGLIPTVILLAVYYTVCDVVILLQIAYYRWLSRKKASRAQPDESAPLLADADAAAAADRAVPEDAKAEREAVARRGRRRAAFFVYFGVLAVILVVGVGGWAVSENKIHLPGRGPPERKPPPRDGDDGLGEEWDTQAQVLGWISAILYLGSRIPQIIKNRETHCKGLSLLFFLLGIFGNITYVLSICLASQEPSHLFITLSWLVGSGGTIGIDLVVCWQFWAYRKQRWEELEKDVDPGSSSFVAVI